MMIKNFKLDIVIIFVFCNCTLHAQENIKVKYDFQLYSGYNRTILNESTSENGYSVPTEAQNRPDGF